MVASSKADGNLRRCYPNSAPALEDKWEPLAQDRLCLGLSMTRSYAYSWDSIMLDSVSQMDHRGCHEQSREIFTCGVLYLPS